jgi:hypothetical protein
MCLADGDLAYDRGRVLRRISRALPTFGALALVVGGCGTRHVIGREPSACAAYSPGPDLALCTATHLGHGGSVSSVALAAEADGALLLGATAPALGFDSDTDVLFGGGGGLLVRLDREGRNVAQIAAVGTAISDVRVDLASGAVVVAGKPFGVARLAPALRDVRWTAAGTFDRVAIGAGAEAVAALTSDGAAVTVYDGEGRELGRFVAAGGGANVHGRDVAIDAATRLVFVTGSLGGATVRPFVEAFGFDGTPVWRTEGWTSGDVVTPQLLAATEGVRIAVGRAGELIYVGVSDGGNTVHHHDPHDLQREIVTTRFDRYAEPSGIGSAMMTFVARLGASDGVLRSAVFHSTRDDATPPHGHDAIASAVAVDARGRVLVVGRQGCCGATTFRSAAGTPLAPVEGDGFALLFAPDLDARPLWTTFGTGGGASFFAAAIVAGRAALAGVQTAAQVAAGSLVTHDALRTTAGGADASAYLAVVPLPP